MLIIRKQCITSVKGGGDCHRRMVSEFLQTGPPLSMRDMLWTPRCDICETAESLIVFLDLPGVAEDQVQIAYDTEHDIIAVYGRREPPAVQGRRYILQKEIVTGRFEKVLRLTTPVDADNITAALENGVLRITLPKG